MKKPYVLLFAISTIFFLGNIMNLKALDEQAFLSEQGDCGWRGYSTGLFYKNLAMQAKTIDERDLLLAKAIENFSNSLKDKTSMGRVYFQISECYYIKGDLSKTEDFAHKAIEVDGKYFPPYNRIYNLKVAAKKYKEAALIIEEYLKLNPRNVFSLYLIGVHYFKYLKNDDKSLEMFDKVIKNANEGDVSDYYLENSYYNTGYIYYSKSNFKRANYFFKKAYEVNNLNYNSVFMLAEVNMNLYNLKEAEKYALMYRKIDGDNIQMGCILARIYYLTENDKARDYLAEIRGNNSFEGLLSLALYSELTQNDSDAEKLLNTIIKYRDNITSPYVAISRIRLRQNNGANIYESLLVAGVHAYQNGLVDVAETMFYKAMKFKKNDSNDIYYYLARTHEEKGNYSLAISYYLNYYNLSKENNILVHIGYLYGMQKKFSKAYSYFDRAEIGDAKNHLTFFFRGLVQIWEEKYKDAKKNIQAAINLKSDDESSYFYLAVVCEKLGDHSKAVESLQLAMRYNPESARVANYLGYLYIERGVKLDEAQNLIKIALEIQPENGAYIDSLGWLYFRKGNYQRALGYLLMAEESLDQSGSPDLVVYDHIGDTYLKLGNKKMALKYWHNALKIEKDKVIEKKIKNVEANQGKDR